MADGQPNLAEALGALAAAQAQTAGHVEALAQAQRAAEQRLAGVEARLDRVDAHVEALAQAQRAAEQRLAGVEARLDRVDAQIEALAQHLDRVDAQIEALVAEARRLVEGFGWLRDRVGRAIGWALEHQYERKAPAYFGTLIRRAHVVTHEELDALLDDALDRGALTDEEKRDGLLVDLVVRGRERPPGGELYLAVEVSEEIWPDDVERAARRAVILEKAVGRTLPVVAGEGIAPTATEKAARLGVWQLLDGHVLPPEPRP